tara:strand:- start:312 stop:776 length:465 start_codon:yes stop_codon:yes gene_type:complete
MSFSTLLIHKANTYDIGFTGSDDYNNPTRMLYKNDSNSNLGCRVQHQVTKERAYSLSEIELLEEVPVNSFFGSNWTPTDSNSVLGISFSGDFSDEKFYLIKTLEIKYDRSSLHHYELALIPSSEFTSDSILGGVLSYSSEFSLEDNIEIEHVIT